MQRKRLGTAAAVAAAMTLLVSACGSKSGASNSAQRQANSGSGTSMASAAPGSGKAIKACMLLDNGGVNDESFNQFSYAGMLEAHKSHPNVAVVVSIQRCK